MIINLICVSVLLTWIYTFFIKKNYLHVITFITFGIFLPVFLYQLDWSELIDVSFSLKYIYIIFVIALISIVYTSLTCNRKIPTIKLNERVKITKFGLQMSTFINVIFVVLYLFENYLGSGTIIPGLVGIDIHNKYSAPIISYVTNASFLFLSFDFLAYKATNKKKYILWMIIIIMIPVVTRSARMVMVMSFIQLLCLYLSFEKEKKEQTKKEKKRAKKRNIILGIFTICLAVGLMSYTNYRMSGYGKYDITYYEMTKWCGPEWLKWFSPFYGYFALSFNNLKINVVNRVVSHNYIGIYSFASLFFGLFQIDNLFGVEGAGQIKGNLITNGSANVPTGFWDYYYDFGLLFFIPFIVAIIILNYFLKKSIQNKSRLDYKVMYCWYVVYFFFMSFQNTLFMSTSLVSGLIMLFIIRRSFKLMSLGGSYYG